MRLSINKSELQNALAIVYKGVSSRSTLPALSGILFEAENDQLTLMATDLELSIRCCVPALIEEEGRALVPGKIINSIIKSLPDAAIHMEGTKENAKVSCGKASFNLSVLNPDDFPAFPVVAPEQEIEVPFNLFSMMVKRVVRVVSRDETRAILTGVLLTLDEGRLSMVATDSYRLAITEAEVESSKDTDPFSAVIAGTFLSDIASLPQSSQTITLGLTDNQIIIHCGNATFINRRIEGKYPNYQQLLPDAWSCRAVMDGEELTAAVRRISLMGTPTTPIRFDLNGSSQTLLLAAQTPDVGSAEETIHCDMEGTDTEIAFNHSYVIDGLSAIPTKQVALEISSPLKPGIFRALPPENYLYLVMPIRIA